MGLLAQFPSQFGRLELDHVQSPQATRDDDRSDQSKFEGALSSSGAPPETWGNPLRSRTRARFGGHRCTLPYTSSQRPRLYIVIYSVSDVENTPSRHHAPPAVSHQSPPPIHISLGVGPEPLKWLVHLPAHPQLINLYRGVAVLGDIVFHPKRRCWSGVFFTVRCFD